MGLNECSNTTAVREINDVALPPLLAALLAVRVRPTWKLRDNKVNFDDFDATKGRKRTFEEGEDQAHLAF